MCNLVIFRSASVVVLNLLSPGNLYKYVSVLPKYDAEQFAPGMDVIETGTESATVNGTEIVTTAAEMTATAGMITTSAATAIRVEVITVAISASVHACL